jgi:D-arabinose 1-dehydrogenase-like Zn-dependent alcohol dehydrogenase
MSLIQGLAAHAAGAELLPFRYDPGELGVQEVEIGISHCGICHSDSYTKEGLFPGIRLLVIGVVDSLAANPLLLITGRRWIKGWYAGTSIDSQQTWRSARWPGARSMNEIFSLSVNEIFSLERAAEGYEHMMSGRARFRVVLTTGN